MCNQLGIAENPPALSALAREAETSAGARVLPGLAGIGAPWWRPNARAGHCPVLYYRAATGALEYFKDKGIALGMVRNKSYKNFIENNEFEYRPGDIMVLYTDGITEAKNDRGDEFGYERLSETIIEVKDLGPK